MLFSSYIFIFCFLPAVLLGFALLQKAGWARASLGWLTAASFFYYGWWNPVYLWMIGASIAANFGLGIFLGSQAPLRRPAFIAGVAANLAALGWYKYLDFAIATWNTAAGASIPLQHIVLPLGISFFTFQQIGYLVDAYRGDVREMNLLDYCFFVTFFPQLIAGPIVHHREILPQAARYASYRMNARDIAVGVSIFSVGLFKKAILADQFAEFSSPVFAEAGAAAPGFWRAWQGALCYAFQLYFDFSGYSDMAIGLGRMFGILIPLNFASPYKAANLSDFWRRWHMTLSRFLRDYLYIALGGNRRGPVRRYANLAVTMVLGGLWHGAGWTFVLWGALHGIGLCIHHAFRALGGKLPRPAGVLLTFLFAVVAWVFFRAADVQTALRILAAMAQPAAIGAIAWQPLLWTLAGLGICWFLPNTQEVFRNQRPAFEFLDRTFRRSIRAPRWGWAPHPAWAVATVAMFVAGVLALSRTSEFIYYQF